MDFKPTPIADLWLVELRKQEDQRGFFARSWCSQAFADLGLPTLAQCSIAYNRARGTLRGLHWQAAPQAEVKLVRCTQGAVFDVVVDLRRHSPTHARVWTVELSAANRLGLLIGEGLAHGYQTLCDGAELFYQMSVAHHAAGARGIRWDDPKLAIEWPLPVASLSDRDATLPRYERLLEEGLLPAPAEHLDQGRIA